MSQKAIAELRVRVEHWSRRLRVTPRLVRVQRMTRKWGSCSAAGTLTLALELIYEDEAFQDFVVAHELQEKFAKTGR